MNRRPRGDLPRRQEPVRARLRACHGRQHQRAAGRDGFLITPTDACLGFLDPAQLARLDAQGQQTGGRRQQDAGTAPRHLRGCSPIRCPDARCVIHTHSTHCVALTLQPGGDELLPPITPYFVMKVGHVPVIPYHRPGDPRRRRWWRKAITRQGEQGVPIRAVMLERLGPNVWHRSPAAAMATLEELEETARSGYDQPAPPAAADPAQIEELRQRLWRPLVTPMPRFAANLSMLYPELPSWTASRPPRRRLQGRGIPVPLRLPARRTGRAAAGERPAAGAVQRPARRLGRGGTRHGLPARARGRVPRGLPACAGLRAGAGPVRGCM
jgi:ribulose-5-phosphate 4-epimerase/fuculose-1-phosphate aldolase